MTTIEKEPQRNPEIEEMNKLITRLIQIGKIYHELRKNQSINQIQREQSPDLFDFGTQYARIYTSLVIVEGEEISSLSCNLQGRPEIRNTERQYQEILWIKPEQDGSLHIQIDLCVYENEGKLPQDLNGTDFAATTEDQSQKSDEYRKSKEISEIKDISDIAESIISTNRRMRRLSGLHIRLSDNAITFSSESIDFQSQTEIEEDFPTITQGPVTYTLTTILEEKEKIKQLMKILRNMKNELTGELKEIVASGEAFCEERGFNEEIRIRFMQFLIQELTNQRERGQQTRHREDIRLYIACARINNLYVPVISCQQFTLKDGQLTELTMIDIKAPLEEFDINFPSPNQDSSHPSYQQMLELNDVIQTWQYSNPIWEEEVRRKIERLAENIFNPDSITNSSGLAEKLTLFPNGTYKYTALQRILAEDVYNPRRGNVFIRKLEENFGNIPSCGALRTLLLLLKDPDI